MRTSPIRRPSQVRPIYPGHRGRKHALADRIRLADLPLIAAAFGITVEELCATAKRTKQ